MSKEKPYNNDKSCERKYPCGDNKCDYESPYIKHTKPNNIDI